ncbi:hypothetical protein GQ602_004976 [Ophiocordyceps camponoti-floridani]|uniref:Uncharacterized protein n=1 Tax=Ophiocordyceps camponoti-floridani TaxID=2030778 RepID=A0A8H4Q4R8_9HYPO|nr:hypothetical protein GQ602_004976 [Ophiocordyceps camponoti-floridani]
MRNDLRSEMRSMRNEMQTIGRKLDDLDHKVDGLDRKMTVSNRNFMARLENSIVVSGEMVLVPLYSSRTGEEIPNCPSTLAELESLSPQEAADLLRELEESVPRALEQRRRQLKLAFGVRTRAV